MRKEKTLIGLLQGLVNLLAEESARNQEFAHKLETLLVQLPEKKSKPKRAIPTHSPKNVPDIHAEWKTRLETDFRLWLRDQPISALRAIIRSEDFDATRRTVKWKEAEKIADFIADRLRERQSRGSAFIGRSEPTPKEENQEYKRNQMEINEEEVALQEFLRERINYGFLGESAKGIAKLILDKGLDTLSHKQKYVYETEILAKYLNLCCKLCSESIPINEAVTALDENDGYCGRCAERVFREKHT